MAGYNPLSYFSFGKKKDATSTSATPATSGRGREGAHASSRGASRAHSEAVAPSPRGRAEAHHEEADEEHEPFLKVTKGNPTEEELAALTAVVAAMQANAAHQEQNTLVGAASRILNRRQRLGASLRPGPGSWRRARPM